MDTIRALLAITPIYGLKIQQMDIKGAYLNGILKECIYMRQPEGFEDETGRVCQLIKTLYGLKQSGREWNNQFNEKLTNFGFRHLRSDPCVYIKHENNGFIIVAVWVDDLLLFASWDRIVTETKSFLQSEWEVTDLGEPNKMVGIEITQNSESITISQRGYIESILRRENLHEMHGTQSPMDPNIKFERNPDDNECNCSNSFARLLGEVQYIANST